MGGAAGNATGGEAGSATGGAAGSSGTGGEAGSETGGSAGSETGGSAGSATGGSAGSSGTGGEAGSATGGSAGGPPAVCGDGTVTPPEFCDDGHQTECGDCNATCTAAGSGSVCGDGQVCEDKESCDDGHQTECGDCNATCTAAGSAAVCGDGQVCGDKEVCDDSNTDVWGTCNDQCTATGIVACGAGAQAVQVFSNEMVGCAGKVLYPNRATLCGPTLHVCSAKEWADGNGTTAPQYNYWVNDPLRYYTGTSDACGASVTDGGYYWKSCSSADSPMRVCADETDPLGNTCNWTECGLDGTSPNEYFGGCNNNWYAGTLCCL